MKTSILAACACGLLLLQAANAFEPPAPKSAIFNFADEARSTLKSYNDQYLKSHGTYKKIPLKKEDASFGDELTLKGFDVLTAYKTAWVAYIPGKFQQSVKLPEKDGEAVFDKFSGDDPFVSIKVKASYFKVGVLKSVEIVVGQEGGDQVITIELVDGGTRIRCMSSEP